MRLSLEELVAAEGHGRTTPELLVYLVGELENKGPAEGLFRLSVAGNALQEALGTLGAARGASYVLLGADVHLVAGCLKAWLRDLPSPVLSPYAAAIPPDLSPAQDDALFEDPAHHRALLLGLPPSHLATIRLLAPYLLSLLLPQNLSVTKMGLEAICTVFSQVLLRNPSSDPFALLKSQPREQKFLIGFLHQYPNIQL